jgi:hypothetical protein
MIQFLFIGLPCIISVILALLCIYSVEKFKEETEKKITIINKNYNIYAEMFARDLQTWHNMQKFLKEKSENHASRLAEVEKVSKMFIKNGGNHGKTMSS